MAAYEIKSAEPPPPGPTSWRAYFERMEINQSFQFTPRDRYKVATAASRYKAANPGWNYTLKAEKDGSGTIWRTA